MQTLRQLSLEALLCIILEIFAYRKERKGPSEGIPKIGNLSQKSNSGGKQLPRNSLSSGNDSDDDTLDVDENWSGTVWQYTILTPFSDQLKSAHQSNKLQTLKGIEKLI